MKIVFHEIDEASGRDFLRERLEAHCIGVAERTLTPASAVIGASRPVNLVP